MKSRMCDSSSDTACTLCAGAHSVLRTRHCATPPPNAYSDRGAAVSRQRLHAAREDPDLPLVVGGAGLHAATQRVEADADHRGVDLAVGAQPALLGARPEPDVGEGAEVRLRGDVVHLPDELLREAARRPREVRLQLAVAGARADVPAGTGEGVVLLECVWS